MLGCLSKKTKMNPPKILSTPAKLAAGFANDFANIVNESPATFSVALSGGSTPKMLFELWSSVHSPQTDWSKVHFFWGDERCVPPDNSESNFGVADELFFSPAEIPTTNIHRVLGEDDPILECGRYSKLVRESLPAKNGLPKFDIVILGMGTDGHTASIFPDQMELLDSDEVCAIATHPDTGQKRVSLTGKAIANAERIAFLITGDSKAEKVAAIIKSTTESNQWPATRFFTLPQTTLYLDSAAGHFLPDNK